MRARRTAGTTAVRAQLLSELLAGPDGREVDQHERSPAGRLVGSEVARGLDVSQKLVMSMTEIEAPLDDLQRRLLGDL